MPYLQTIIDYYEEEGFIIPNDNSAETLYESLEKKWKPNNRFPIWKILGSDLPDFIVWLQEQIDDEREDDTETITFKGERTETDSQIQKEISDTKAELLAARKELLEREIEEHEERRGGIINGIKSFIRSIFRG